MGEAQTTQSHLLPIRNDEGWGSAGTNASEFRCVWERERGGGGRGGETGSLGYWEDPKSQQLHCRGEGIGPEFPPGHRPGGQGKGSYSHFPGGCQGRGWAGWGPQG